MDKRIVIGLGLVILLLVLFIISFMVTVVFKEEKDEIMSDAAAHEAARGGAGCGRAWRGGKVGAGEAGG